MKKGVKTKLIIALFSVAIITNFIIASEGTEVYIDQSERTSATGCAQGSELCWNDAIYGKSGTYLQGIRVSAVDNNGDRLSGTTSVNYAKVDSDTEIVAYNYVTNPNNPLKIRITTEDYTKLEVVEFKKSDSNLSRKLGYFDTQRLKKYDYKDNKDFKLPPTYNRSNHSTKLSEFFKKIANPNAEEEVKDFFRDTFLVPIGYNPSNYTEEELNTHYFMVEPLFYFRYGYHGNVVDPHVIQYFGTVTEVVKMQEEDIRAWDTGCTIGSYWHHANPTPGCDPMGGSHRFDYEIPLMIYISGQSLIAGLQGIDNFLHSKGGYNYYGEVLTTNGVAAGVFKINQVPCKDCEDLDFAIMEENAYNCCLELYEIHDANGDVDIRDYLSLTPPSCCSALKGKIDSATYEEYCEEEPPPEICEYKLDVWCPINCDDEELEEEIIENLPEGIDFNQGFVKDIAVDKYEHEFGEAGNMHDWECIFESEDSSDKTVREHYRWKDGAIENNPYCEIYCREEISYTFPQYGFEVKGGHHFIVGEVGLGITNSWHPIFFSGTQQCRTKGDGDKMTINHEKFVDEYNTANEDVWDAWERYQQEIAYDNWIEESYTKGPSGDPCDYYCEYNCSKCSQFDDSPGCFSGGKCCISTKTIHVKPVTCPPKAKGCTPSPGYSYDVCTGYSSMPPHSFVYYPVDPQPGNGDYLSYTTLKKWCPGCVSKPSASVAHYEGLYNQAVNNRDMLLKYIFDCSDWDRKYDTFLPEVSIEYEEDKYGFLFDYEDEDGFEPSKLVGNIDDDDFEEEFYEGSDYKITSDYLTAEIDSWSCLNIGKECENIPVDYPINENRETIRTKSYNYTLGSDIYRFVTKPRGVSQHKKPSNPDEQYLNLGFPNLPIHYSRVPREEGFFINLKYTSFGPNNKFNEYIFDEGYGVEKFAGKEYECDNIYNCKYMVNNKFMYCDEVENECIDIQAIFRPVSLIEPFPGRTGVGRTPGSNWIGKTDLITNSRGLTNGAQLYSQKDPMYEIVLTPNIIGRIKNHNRTTINGYSDFNLECIEGTGRECESKFIREKFEEQFKTSRCISLPGWDICRN